MNHATQAALTAAQAALQTAHATWALFDVTAALVLITGLAVFFGKRAADLANNTYRLEAEPVLILTAADRWTTPQAGRDSIPLERTYVITGAPALIDGLVLRRWQKGDRSGPRDPGLSTSSPTSLTPEQQKPWWSLVLQIQNAGRSPAVQVEIDVDLARPALLQPGQRMVGFESDPDELTDSGSVDLSVGTQRGNGTVKIPAIGPQSTVLIRIENHLGDQARLTPRTEGRQVDWRDRRRATRPIAIIVPDESFELNSGYDLR